MRACTGRKAFSAILLFSLACLVHTSAAFAADPPRIQAGRLRVELDRFINYPPSSELLIPVFIAAPDDGTGRLFFAEKGVAYYPIPETPPYGYSARIRMYSNGAFSTFLDLSNEINAESESGLLGLAFHPGFADPSSPGYRTLYTFHSAFADENAAIDFDTTLEPINHHNVLTEWKVSASNPNVVDLSSRREIFRAAHPSDIHNSGTITFGPDGYLYGSIGTPPVGTAALLTAQDNSDIYGSIFRIDPLAPSATPGSANPLSANGKYRIPADNPFVNDPLALDEIYAYGLRNAYRFSIDPVSGLLFAGEVGDVLREEVDVIPKGGNMGWPYIQGTGEGPVPLPNPPLPAFVAPIAEYSHDDGTAVVGGHIYHGSIPALQNKYIFGDFSNNFFAGHGRLLVADVFDEFGQLKDAADIEIQEMLLEPQSCSESGRPNPSCSFDTALMSFGLDANGELYAIGFDPSQAVVYRFTDAYLLSEGDYNEDGIVDASDYTMWRDTFGQSVPFGSQADGDGSGMIDTGDYEVWKAHFGETMSFGAASSSPINVPGPHSLILAFQVGLGVLTSIRRAPWKRHAERGAAIRRWRGFFGLSGSSQTPHLQIS